METVTITDPGQIEAILGDERFTVVPPAPQESGGLAWVRANAARFSEGETHRRRRGLAERELTAASPEVLSALAREETRAVYAADPGGDVWPTAMHCGYSKATAFSRVERRLIRDVPIRVLGRALGVTDVRRLVEPVWVAGSGYLTGAEPTPGLEAAVATLVELLGPGEDEVVAARIALLLQAQGPLFSLLCAVFKRDMMEKFPSASARGMSADELIAEALDHAPPVGSLRRVTGDEVEVDGVPRPPGTLVLLDLHAAAKAGARGMEFGGGRRPCPGHDQAVAIATAIVEEVLAR